MNNISNAAFDRFVSSNSLCLFGRFYGDGTIGAASIERTRHFSRRARLNMVSYYKLEKDGNATTPMDVNKFKKVRKSHTNIIDECHGYISGILRRMIVQTKR